MNHSLAIKTVFKKITAPRLETLHGIVYFTITTSPILAIVLARTTKNIVVSLLAPSFLGTILLLYITRIGLTRACRLLVGVLSLEHSLLAFYTSILVLGDFKPTIIPATAAITVSTLLLYYSLKRLLQAENSAYTSIATCIRNGIGLGVLLDKVIDSTKLLEKARVAGVSSSSLEYRFLISTIIGLALIFYPLALATTTLLGTLGIFTLLLPILILGGLYTHFSSKASDRARLAEEEQAFLALWAWLLERSGTGSLTDALYHADSSKLFKSIHLDARTSISELAETHPSHRLRRFYRYYSAIRNAGGDIVKFLEDTVDTSINELRHTIESYAEKGNAIGTLVLGSMSTILMFIMFSVLLGFTGILPYTLVLVMVLAIIGWILLHTTQPRLRDDVRDERLILLSLTASTAVGLLAWWMSISLVYLLALPLLVFTSVYGAWFAWFTRRVSREEEDTITLLRLLIEHARAMPEKPLYTIARELYATNRTEVEGIQSIILGKNTPASWLARYAGYTLREFVAKRGAVDLLALERLYDLLYTYHYSRRIVAGRLRVLAGLPIGFPPIVVIALRLLENITVDTTSILLLPLTVVDTGAVTVASLLTAVLMGFIASKTISLTIRNTIYPLSSLATLLLAVLIPLNLG